MPRNIELKARLRDPESAAATAAELATDGPARLVQCDTYFTCPNGRLKLREHETGPTQLIWYRRENALGAKPSQYELVEVSDADVIKRALAGAWGIDTIVKKRRQVWWVDNVRIHIDHVAQLGHFLEFEAVLGGLHDDSVEATRVVDKLAKRMGVLAADRIAISYREMFKEINRETASCEVREIAQRG